MKHSGAVEVIEGLLHIYSRFRTANSYIDNMLLGSLRAAQMYLGPGLGTLLSELENIKSFRKYDRSDETRDIELWNRIRPSLQWVICLF